MSLSVPFGVLRTKELRELLEDEDKINHIVRSSEKLCLLKKINHAEEECELLLQRFVEGETTLADFLGSFLSLRKLHHIRLVLVKKLQERTELQPTERLSEIQPQIFSAGFHHQILPVSNFTTAVVLPVLHPPFLLPFNACVNTAQCPQYLSLCFDNNEAQSPGKFPKWPTRPVRLQPLKVEQRKHQHAPQ
ncbi:hypothetical protein PAMP_018401 [Pampus punctatissimus]